MAGDWIKMRHDLQDDPAVIAVASSLGIRDRDLVVGKLHRLWTWFDRHTSDGNARGVTQSFVDALVDVAGFASALASVGWLDVRDGAIQMPNFDRHLSKSAKHRALGQERSQRFRNGAGVTTALPEKRREEKSNKPLNPLSGFSIAFQMAWDSWPPKRRSKKEAAQSAWVEALARLQIRHGGDPRKAEDWLLQRVREFARSPKASGPYCQGIAKWIADGSYDDAAEAWQDSGEELPPTSTYQEIAPYG